MGRFTHHGTRHIISKKYPFCIFKRKPMLNWIWGPRSPAFHFSGHPLPTCNLHIAQDQPQRKIFPHLNPFSSVSAGAGAEIRRCTKRINSGSHEDRPRGSAHAASCAYWRFQVVGAFENVATEAIQVSLKFQRKDLGWSFDLCSPNTTWACSPAGATSKKS